MPRHFTHTNQLLTFTANLLCCMLVVVLSASCSFSSKDYQNLTPNFGSGFNHYGDENFFDCTQFDRLMLRIITDSDIDSANAAADTAVAIIDTSTIDTDTAGVDSASNFTDNSDNDFVEDSSSTITGYSTKCTNDYSQLYDNTLITECDSVTIQEEALYSFLDDTCPVIVATQDIPNDWGLELVGEKYDAATFVDDLKSITTPETEIKIESTGQTITIPQSLATRHFAKNYLSSILRHLKGRPISSKVLASCNGNPVAIKLTTPNGGVVTLISVPLIFTNYGLSYAKNCHAIIQLLCDAGLKDTEEGHYLKPFIRYYPSYNYNRDNHYQFEEGIKAENIEKSANDTKNFLKYNLEEILYILVTIIGVLIVPLLVRRRQQVIPVYKAPTNHTAEFVKQVSKVYLQQKEFGIILRKRIIYFFSEVQDRFHIQLANEQDLDANTAMLAAVTNTDARELRLLIKHLQKQLRLEPMVIKEEMINYIDQIEKLTEAISNVK